MPVDLPVLTIADAAAWSNWLVRSATTSRGVWLTLAKKGNTTPTSLTYAQALDEALCQGWIDGQARGGDERTYSQRFTPRTAKSLWSRRNAEHVARLEKEGRITAAGRAAIDAAKADGRWDTAYAGQSTAEPPPEFLAAVAAVPEAQAMWDTLNRSNRFAIYFRLNALKTQAGKEKRIAAFVEMLARGESLLPQKQTGGAAARKTATASVKTAASKAAGGRRRSRRGHDVRLYYVVMGEQFEDRRV
ncbi:bacteriocin-protection, YdeI or OmpD-associated-domain-containing protein [Xylaria digitata]|nr:bacteriocin-protection, YdeI or OmpD-associated-domain-containing protein [Xylaria digitata]